MTPREEFEVAIEQLEETVTQMALLVMTFRRLLRELKEPDHPKADFDYRTGMPPK